MKIVQVINTKTGLTFVRYYGLPLEGALVSETEQDFAVEYSREEIQGGVQIQQYRFPKDEFSYIVVKEIEDQ